MDGRTTYAKIMITTGRDCGVDQKAVFSIIYRSQVGKIGSCHDSFYYYSCMNESNFSEAPNFRVT